MSAKMRLAVWMAWAMAIATLIVLGIEMMRFTAGGG